MQKVWGFPKYKVEWPIKDCNGLDKTEHFYSDSWLRCWWRVREMKKRGILAIWLRRND